MLSLFLMRFLGAALLTTLYLGGWALPFIPATAAFVLKSLIVVTIIIWLEHSLPRMKLSHMLELAWKWFVPLAFINVFITVVIMEVLGWV